MAELLHLDVKELMYNNLNCLYCLFLSITYNNLIRKCATNMLWIHFIVVKGNDALKRSVVAISILDMFTIKIITLKNKLILRQNYRTEYRITSLL